MLFYILLFLLFIKEKQVGFRFSLDLLLINTALHLEKNNTSMDKHFIALLAITTVFSIYEVVSNGGSHEDERDRSAESRQDEDSFDQFNEEPAYKYREEAQQDLTEDEQVQIREPTRSGPGDTFKPPLNMPPIKFAFCVSCGYRQAFEQFGQILREKYPGIDLVGENYSPGIVRALSTQVIGFAKIAFIVCIVMGRDPFPSFGIATPQFFQWMLGNKVSSALMVFLLSNVIEGMLQSTGAFEIYIEGERIWSKLESGRIPSPPELFQLIDSHFAIRGSNKFAGASFGIDNSN